MLKVQNPVPATRGAHTSWRQRLVRFVRRHPMITFLVIFNTFGQAVAFVPVSHARCTALSSTPTSY